MYSHIISILRSILQTEEIIESNKCTVYGKQSEKNLDYFVKCFWYISNNKKRKDCLLRVLVLALETVQRTKH